jgi:hypothetical protein
MDDEAVSTGERRELIASAQALEQLAAASTDGEWKVGGLLATRPEIVAHGHDGSTEHVAEARMHSAAWITTLSPALAPFLANWLRSAAHNNTIDSAAVSFARALRCRLPGSRDASSLATTDHPDSEQRNPPSPESESS